MNFINETAEGINLAVTIQPRAARNQIVGLHDDALKIKLTAPPVDNAANKMCIQYLAKCLGLPKSALEIVSGRTSRNKQLLIRPRSGKDAALELAKCKKKLHALAEGK